LLLRIGFPAILIKTWQGIIERLIKYATTKPQRNAKECDGRMNLENNNSVDTT